MSGYVVADGQLAETVDSSDITDFLFERQLPVPALLNGILRVIERQPALYSSVDPQEFDQDFLALNVVYPVSGGTNKIWYERRQSDAYVETEALQLFDGLDALGWWGGHFVLRCKMVVAGCYGNLNMCQIRIHNSHISVVCD